MKAEGFPSFTLVWCEMRIRCARLGSRCSHVPLESVRKAGFAVLTIRCRSMGSYGAEAWVHVQKPGFAVRKPGIRSSRVRAGSWACPRVRAGAWAHVLMCPVADMDDITHMHRWVRMMRDSVREPGLLALMCPVKYEDAFGEPPQVRPSFLTLCVSSSLFALSSMTTSLAIPQGSAPSSSPCVPSSLYMPRQS